jgi:hypothetical protein
MKEELDKQGFQQIINMQNQQIEQLAYLAQLTVFYFSFFLFEFIIIFFIYKTQMTAEKIKA